MSPSDVSEHQLLEAVRQVPFRRWGEVLAFVTELHEQETRQSLPKQWTATDLLKLPLAERDAILAEQAARAAADYASNPELTAFDAFGEQDLYVDSSNAQSR
jgi:hypothetical protein